MWRKYVAVFSLEPRILAEQEEEQLQEPPINEGLWTGCCGQNNQWPSGKSLPQRSANPAAGGSAFKHKLFHAAQTHGEEAETAACEYQ